MGSEALSGARSRLAVAAPGRSRRSSPGVRIVLTASMLGANAIGVLIVVTFATLVLPLPDVENNSDARLVNAIATGAYLLVVTPFGVWWGLRRLREAREWLEEDRTPTPEERRIVLRGPRRIVVVHVVLWGLAALFFGLNLAYSAESALRLASLIVFGGLSTCSVVYLISERQLRPAAARALAAGIDERRLAPGGDDAHPDRVRPRRGPTAHRHDDDRDLVPGRAGLQRSRARADHARDRRSGGDRRRRDPLPLAAARSPIRWSR